jgi:hypothetical protein
MPAASSRLYESIMDSVAFGTNHSND